MVAKRRARRRRGWWTLEHVLDGLRRFHALYGETPCSTEEWHARVRGTGPNHHGAGNPFPSFYGVLKHFATFRQAWTAAGFTVDRGWEEWTADELWYLDEAAGIYSRAQIAADLGRSEGSVKRKLYDRGQKVREMRGWALERVARHARTNTHRLTRAIARGELPVFRGTQAVYVDPGDLVGLPGIDPARFSPELEYAVRRSLVTRVCATLEGRDWTADRLYRTERTELPPVIRDERKEARLAGLPSMDRRLALVLWEANGGECARAFIAQRRRQLARRAA